MEKNINKANYSIKKDDIKKSIRIDINGFFGKNDINEYLKDYSDFIKSVDLKNTILMLNGKDLKAFPREAEPDLAKLYENYSTFKKVFIVTPAQVVTKMQVKRVLKANNLESHFNFIDKIEDVL